MNRPSLQIQRGGHRVLSLDEAIALDPAQPRLAVLGHPIQHSLSPAMHNAALHALRQTCGAFHGWVYVAVEVLPDRLSTALEGLSRAGFVGLNLTLPHKVDALEFIDQVDEAARMRGAVNTLCKRSESSGWEGFNTDGYGLLRAIVSEMNLNPCEHPVVILGAGGAARAAVIEMLDAGCKSVHVVNRSSSRLAGLMTSIQAHPRCSSVFPLTLDELDSALHENSLIINATSLGLKGEDPSPLPVSLLRKGMKVYDMTYGCLNALRQACRDKSCCYCDGLGMLVWQGARAFEMWTKMAAPASIMRSSVESELRRRSRNV